MTSKIAKCTCKHDDQDQLYGPGNRLANETRSGQLRCTVCGATLGSANLATAVKATQPSPKEQVEKKVADKKAAKNTPTATKKPDKVEKKKSMKGGKR